MTELHRIGSLEINQNMRAEKAEWAFERISYYVMLTLVFAALLGFFGSGPLSWTRAGASNEALQVEYHRFARYQAPVEMKVHFRLNSNDRTEVPVSISSDYLQGVYIHRIEPEPFRKDIGEDSITYFFKAHPANLSTVTFHLEPEKIGYRTAKVNALNQTKEIKQFIYP